MPNLAQNLPIAQLETGSSCRPRLAALASRLEQAVTQARDADAATACIEVARELRSIAGDQATKRLYPVEVQQKLDLPVRQCAILLIHLLNQAGTVQTHADLAQILSVKADRTDVVKVYIHGIRAALAPHQSAALVQTSYARGYFISKRNAAEIHKILA
jgi:DNA-binding response OmpR family regulator